MRGRDGSAALPRPVLVLLGIAALAVIVLSLISAGDESAGRAAAERAAVSAPGVLGAQPGEAALLALASYRLDPSTDREFTMLGVAADEDGIERVIDTGAAQATAAIRTDRLAVVAGSDRVLGVWRLADGALLGRVRTEHPVTAMAEGEETSLIALGDSAGALSLLDLSDPRRPRLRRIYPAENGEPVLALSFSADATTVLALSAAGKVERVRVATGRLVDGFSLREAAGPLPWARNSRGLALTAATFGIEDFAEDEPVTVATADGAVARVRLARKQGETVLRAGIAPGRVTSIALEPYEGPRTALATTGGLVNLDSHEDEPRIERGPPVTGVAIDYQNHLWLGSGEGVSMGPAYSGWSERPPAGRPVIRLIGSSAGLLAIYPHGVVSLLGRRSTGLSLPDVSTTTVASFGDHGELLTSEGYDANHIERLWTRRPGHTEVHGELVRSPKLSSYEPDPSWWETEDEEEGGLYVNDAVIDDGMVAVGGQDPTGEAVVLAWDRRSGKPLRRLPLGIGEIEAAVPSIVTNLVLIPGKHMIAAYSTVQQLVAIWSTDSWRQLAAVPVGQVGDLSLSPDESTLLATGTAAEEAEPPGRGAKLIFIDVEDGSVRDEVSGPGLLRAAWSPDGSRIATIDEEGRLELRSAGGKPDLAPPVRFDSQPTALAWRPDGRAIAVGLDSGSVALVDAETGVSTPQLPAEANLKPLRLSWSPDGRFLAASTGTEEEQPEPGPARLWTLAAPRLERRMCELAGTSLDPSTWQEVLGDDVPARPLCRMRREDRRDAADEGSGIGRTAVAYSSDGSVFAADWDGQVARIGSVDDESFEPLAFRWSGDDMAWGSPGRIDVFVPGESRPRWWPCPCDGFAWRGGKLIALEDEGRALLEISPDRLRPRRIPLAAPVGSYPRLLGVVGGKAVVSGYVGEPSRATPSTLYLVGPAGGVSKVPGTTPGVVSYPSAASGRTLAFVASLSGGVCYTTTKVGVLRLGRDGRPRVEYPPMPGGERYEIVRSLQLEQDETVSAAIAPLGCRDNEALDREPEATRYELRGRRWVATEGRGGDVQAAGSGSAVLGTSEDSREGAQLRLLPADGEALAIAQDVDEMGGRP